MTNRRWWAPRNGEARAEREADFSAEEAAHRRADVSLADQIERAHGLKIQMADHSGGTWRQTVRYD